MRLVLAVLLAFTAPVAAGAADRLQFWNLTSSTLVEVSLAPVGTSNFGPNQCANDRDGSVDHDERLRLTGVTPGRYDVRVVTKKGQRCLARDVAVSREGRFAFSLADEDLKDCRPVR